MRTFQKDDTDFRRVPDQDWGDIKFAQAIDLLIEANAVASYLMSHFIRERRAHDSFAAEDAHQNLRTSIERLSRR